MKTLINILCLALWAGPLGASASTSSTDDGAGWTVRHRVVACFIDHEGREGRTFFQDHGTTLGMPSIDAEPHWSDAQALKKLLKTCGAEECATRLPFMHLEQLVPDVQQKITTAYYVVDAKPTLKGVWAKLGNGELWPERYQHATPNPALKPVEKTHIAQFMHSVLYHAISQWWHKDTLFDFDKEFLAMLKQCPGTVGYMTLTQEAFHLYAQSKIAQDVRVKNSQCHLL